MVQIKRNLGYWNVSQGYGTFLIPLKFINCPAVPKAHACRLWKPTGTPHGTNGKFWLWEPKGIPYLN